MAITKVSDNTRGAARGLATVLADNTRVDLVVTLPMADGVG